MLSVLVFVAIVAALLGVLGSLNDHLTPGGASDRFLRRADNLLAGKNTREDD